VHGDEVLDNDRLRASFGHSVGVVDGPLRQKSYLYALRVYQTYTGHSVRNCHVISFESGSCAELRNRHQKGRALYRPWGQVFSPYTQWRVSLDRQRYQLYLLRHHR
jgi:hypothetical protein